MTRLSRLFAFLILPFAEAFAVARYESRTGRCSTCGAMLCSGCFACDCHAAACGSCLDTAGGWR